MQCRTMLTRCVLCVVGCLFSIGLLWIPCYAKEDPETTMAETATETTEEGGNPIFQHGKEEVDKRLTLVEDMLEERKPVHLPDGKQKKLYAGLQDVALIGQALIWYVCIGAGILALLLRAISGTNMSLRRLAYVIGLGVPIIYGTFIFFLSVTISKYCY